MLKYKHPPPPPEISKLADFFAPKMFVLGLFYLVVIGIILHWWNQDPILDEFEKKATGKILLVLWLPFWLELLFALFNFKPYEKKYRRILLIALIPATRLAVSPHTGPEWIWLPRWGWKKRSRTLCRALERRLALPMLGVTLMILPVLIAEFFLHHWIEAHTGFKLTLNISLVFIWFAFATELIIMTSVSIDRWFYLKTHWVNVLIVLLPTFAFLRAFRLLKLAQLAKLSKLLKIYRLRSVLVRFYESLLALSLVEKLIHRNPEKMRDHLLYQIEKTEYELKELKQRLAELEQKYPFPPRQEEENKLNRF